ncbi:unnamed protein product [Psylliodes chrysocephalus]|uniref:Selenoprotein F n=1 Tax=Psylliodes chrysocephalus TaxID=3402493 RepID=A0A9P0G8W9_9CUCU|nr:unnamed protein product [Psylliodes chrysocephala]
MKTIIFQFLIIFIYSSSAEFSTEDCWALGFHKADLLCSSCDQLTKFELDDLLSHCKECCHRDEVNSTEKTYYKAVLEVCTCKFGAYPQIQAFIKSERPDKYPNLQIKYVRGLDPIIKMYDKDGHLQETVAIEKWNTDSVDEFLSTHLIKLSDDDFLRTNMV